MLKDQEDLLKLFNAHSVEYVVVGAHAVGAYTEPRGTKDIDILVRDTPENGTRVFRALAEFGAPIAQYQPGNFHGHPDAIIQFGVPPARIDILQKIEGVDMDEVWHNRTRNHDMDGTKVDLISLDDLIKNKRSVGRLQDLADVEKLEMYKKS